MIPNAIEHNIVTSSISREVLPRVIDHMIRANRANHLHIPRATYAGNLRANPFGNLDCERAHPARRTIDQNFLPRLQPCLIAKTLHRRESRNRNTPRLVERHVRRLWD
jgi:hypothetical protein